MKKILVPMDFSTPSLEAFQFALDLANKSGGSITVLNVINLPTSVYGPSIDMPVYLYDLEMLNDLKLSAKRRFDQVVKKYSKGFKRIKFVLEQGYTFPVIREHVANKKFDLVVMGTHGATGLREFFIGSNAEKVVRFSKAPVLVIRKAVPVSSIKNIVFPTFLQAGQSGFIKKLKILQKFFNARLHVLYLNTPLNFIRDNELKEFAKRYHLTNYTLNIRNDRYEPDGIISFAHEVKACMLAMPTHARKGLAHFVSGSVTEDVVNHIEYPIWTYALKT
jgi:nucleotide-binding universal stress UspA family protein